MGKMLVTLSIPILKAARINSIQTKNALRKGGLQMLKKSLYFVVFSLLSVALVAGSLLADAGPQHQVRQVRPIQLGTSGGDVNDMSSGYCCSGTLGALVEDDIAQYILSNNHVLARTNVAMAGEGIIQPGLIDQFGRQCKPGWGVKGVSGAKQKSQQDDMPGLYPTGECQPGQNECQDHHAGLGDHHHRPARNPVGP